MEYKLCILAAGVGKRMLPLTKDINKALLPVNFKAAITHIIEKFPHGKEIIIAVNYQELKIKEYLSCAHPERKIKYIFVDKIKGKGAGPGYSVLCCEKHLQVPFILTAVDTLVKEEYYLPNNNWIGVDDVEDASEFCGVEISNNNGKIKSIKDKSLEAKNKVFIGLAGIKDYKLFFSGLHNDTKEINGELQLSNGLKALIKSGIDSMKFSWTDIGKLKSYYDANKKLSKSKDSFDFSKTDEYIYFTKDKVIKYFLNSKTILNRYERSLNLKSLTPKINKKTNNFYSYDKLEGKVIYESKNINITKSLLQWLEDNLWKTKELNSIEKKVFKSSCKNFYYDKTLDRLNLFYERFNLKDTNGKVNGKFVLSTKDLIKKLDFDNLTNGIPSKFHGDLQFDNILITSENNFKLLDWRQDFAGIIEYGDKYYDLAKLNGGLYISYKKIKEGSFKYEGTLSNCFLSIEDDKFLSESKKIFNEFVIENNLDLKKIEILTGLIFLNMSPMHHYPFSYYVYNLGRLQLIKNIDL